MTLQNILRFGNINNYFCKCTEGIKVNTIFFDSTINDELRRQHLYNGQCSSIRLAQTIAMCEFARELIEEAFRPLDRAGTAYRWKVCGHFGPQTALYSSSQVKTVYSESSVNRLKHNLLRRAANENRDEWGYLSSGIAYAFHPHRDTVLRSLVPTELVVSYLRRRAGQCYGFHPRYWSQPVKNGSSGYNYE